MLEKIPKIDFYVGQKCLVIGGVKCEDQESTPRMHVRPGDLVEVVGVYKHHVMVESKYRFGSGSFRECFCRNGIQNDLKVWD